MSWRCVDTEMLEGIFVEWFDVGLDDAVLATWSERKYFHLRKTAPLNRLLPHTLLWAKELPPQVVPELLMKQFPRIGNLLAANWKERTAFQNYLESLFVDRRGSRQGFAAEIKKELIRLRTYYYLGESAIIETAATSDSTLTTR
jgi:hypothetical protein